MKYTHDQEEALTSMIAWSEAPIKTPDDLLYTLDGAAGTGKTTVTREFLQRLAVRSSRIAVTAPTHKAKKVIQDATDYRSQTIQKLLGLRPDVEMDKFDINKPVFLPLGEDEMQYYSYVLIDESSMLNKEAFDLIKTKAKRYNVRVVFLGDAYQLPPINEHISQVFSNVKNKSTLTTIIRQGDDNPMTEILLMLRDDVKNSTDFGIKKLVETISNVSNDKGFRCLSNTLEEKYGDATFGSEMLPYYYSSEYKVNKEYIKFLTYTNDSVEEWCAAIRKQILKEDAENLLNVGEVLTGYNSITDRRHNTLILENSEDYVVESVQSGTSGFGIRGFIVDLVNSRGSERQVFVVDHTDLTKFKEVAREKLDAAIQNKGRYWPVWYNFKNQHLLLVNTYKNDSLPKNAYGNLLCKKDIYYGYGCTVHKSQGSTYENVAINLANIYKNPELSERARLIYVALSRTKNMNLIMVK